MPLFEPLHFRFTKRYKAANEWAAGFSFPAQMLPDALSDASDLAYEFAWRCYEELEARRHALEEKADKLMVFAGTTLVLQFTIVSYLRILPHWSLKVSGIAFLVAIVPAMLARRAVLRPALPRINLICEGLKVAGQRKLWIATTLHPLCTSLEDVLDWTARWVEISFSIIIVGLLAMIPTLLGVSAGVAPAGN